MPHLGYYEQGTWNALCDICGRGFKFNQLRLTWDKSWRCTQCWEIDQPQKYVRGVKDNPAVPISRPRADLTTPFQWTNGPLLFNWTNGLKLFTWTN